MTIENICNTGNYDFQTGWKDIKIKEGQQPLVYLLNTSGEDATDSPRTIFSSNDPDAKDEDKIGETEAAYVLPFDYTTQSEMEVYLGIVIDVKCGDDIVIKGKRLQATLNPSWAIGYSYIYNIELNASTINLNKIEFTVDEKIVDWENGGEIKETLDKE